MNNTEELLIESYNCGGFAFETYDWLTPYIREENMDETTDTWTEDARLDLIKELNTTEIEDALIANAVLFGDVCYLKRHYKNYVIVTDATASTLPNVVAYRVGVDTSDPWEIDTDFHFRKKINGIWFEKMGDSPVHLCENYSEDPWYCSSTTYNSNIIYFAKKEEVDKVFSVGDKIRINHMSGENGYDGREGVITHIDDAGTLFGTWGGLGVVLDEDDIEKISDGNLKKF